MAGLLAAGCRGLNDGQQGVMYAVQSQLISRSAGLDSGDV